MNFCGYIVGMTLRCKTNSILGIIVATFFLQMFFCLSSWSQPGRTKYLSPEIHTLRMGVNGIYECLPIIELGSKDVMEVSFDYLSHDYKRFTYKIEHCDFDGNITTDLFDNQYVRSAFNEEVIEDYQTSQNTTVLYTHYTFTIPNVRMRPLLSGNYLLTISSEDVNGDVVPMVQTYFAVIDSKVRITAECSSNTDIDWNDVNQQLSIKVDCGTIPINQVEREVSLLVLQNYRFDNAVYNPSITSQDGSLLSWDHARSLIFRAGNEFRKMEILSTKYPGMHGDYLRWFDPYYHYVLLEDSPRTNYLYDEDRNGVFWIRDDESYAPDIEADYVITHFSLSMPHMPDRNFYVYGNWTRSIWKKHKMSYNLDNNAYEADVLLKLGYYNYMYLSEKNGITGIGWTDVTEGDFFQTENRYDILFYYKPIGSRYHQLIGHNVLYYKN